VVAFRMRQPRPPGRARVADPADLYPKRSKIYCRVGQFLSKSFGYDPPHVDSKTTLGDARFEKNARKPILETPGPQITFPLSAFFSS
jgi:hypothetical protein